MQIKTNNPYTSAENSRWDPTEDKSREDVILFKSIFNTVRDVEAAMTESAVICIDNSNMVKPTMTHVSVGDFVVIHHYDGGIARNGFTGIGNDYSSGGMTKTTGIIKKISRIRSGSTFTDELILTLNCFINNSVGVKEVEIYTKNIRSISVKERVSGSKVFVYTNIDLRAGKTGTVIVDNGDGYPYTSRLNPVYGLPYSYFTIPTNMHDGVYTVNVRLTLEDSNDIDDRMVANLHSAKYFTIGSVIVNTKRCMQMITSETSPNNQNEIIGVQNTNVRNDIKTCSISTNTEGIDITLGDNHTWDDVLQDKLNTIDKIVMHDEDRIHAEVYIDDVLVSINRFSNYIAYNVPITAKTHINYYKNNNIIDTNKTDYKPLENLISIQEYISSNTCEFIPIVLRISGINLSMNERVHIECKKRGSSVYTDNIQCVKYTASSVYGLMYDYYHKGDIFDITISVIKEYRFLNDTVENVVNKVYKFAITVDNNFLSSARNIEIPIYDQYIDTDMSNIKDGYVISGVPYPKDDDTSLNIKYIELELDKNDVLHKLKFDYHVFVSDVGIELDISKSTIYLQNLDDKKVYDVKPENGSHIAFLHPGKYSIEMAVSNARYYGEFTMFGDGSTNLPARVVLKSELVVSTDLSPIKFIVSPSVFDFNTNREYIADDNIKFTVGILAVNSSNETISTYMCTRDYTHGFTDNPFIIGLNDIKNISKLIIDVHAYDSSSVRQFNIKEQIVLSSDDIKHLLSTISEKTMGHAIIENTDKYSNYHIGVVKTSDKYINIVCKVKLVRHTAVDIKLANSDFDDVLGKYAGICTVFVNNNSGVSFTGVINPGHGLYNVPLWDGDIITLFFIDQSSNNIVSRRSAVVGFDPKTDEIILLPIASSEPKELLIGGYTNDKEYGRVITIDPSCFNLVDNEK